MRFVPLSILHTSRRLIWHIYIHTCNTCLRNDRAISLMYYKRLEDVSYRTFDLTAYYVHSIACVCVCIVFLSETEIGEWKLHTFELERSRPKTKVAFAEAGSVQCTPPDHHRHHHHQCVQLNMVESENLFATTRRKQKWVTVEPELETYLYTFIQLARLRVKKIYRYSTGSRSLKPKFLQIMMCRVGRTWHLSGWTLDVVFRVVFQYLYRPRGTTLTGGWGYL